VRTINAIYRCTAVGAMLVASSALLAADRPTPGNAPLIVGAMRERLRVMWAGTPYQAVK
jgi:hypothetical protein